MTRKVATTKADEPILEAANVMLYQQISGLPVDGDTGKLVGIVSEGDFIRRSEIGTQRKRRWLKILVGSGVFWPLGGNFQAAFDLHQRPRLMGAHSYNYQSFRAQEADHE